MKTKLNRKGFTIIEVLIVLAIAGLILLIVFLAVPALQRNSRNTQRKNEVASVIGAMSEFTNNNSGSLPVACGAVDSGTADPNGNPATATTLTAATAANNCASGTTAAIAAQLWLKNAQIKYYTNASVGFVLNAAAPAAVPAISDVNGVLIVNFLRCNGNVATTTGASLRSVVALYGVESGGKNLAQCQESGS